MKSQNLYYEKYFKLGLIGMAVTSLEKGWLMVNDTLCDMLGYTSEELTKLTWAELTHPDDLESDVTQFNRVLASEIEGYSMDKRFFHKEGKVIYAIISVSAVRLANGSIDHFVAFVQDISNQKANELKLRNVNEKLEVLVEQRTKELKEANKKLQIESETDHLTQLPNRRFYERRLEENIATARRDSSNLALLIIDIDRFKAYNDKYGHDIGDKVLYDVANVIKQTINRSTDLAARFGGEEFVIILPTTGAEGAMLIAEQIRTAIESLGIENTGIGSNVLTVSIRVCANTLNKQDLFKRADNALYLAKENRNCCRLSKK